MHALYLYNALAPNESNARHTPHWILEMFGCFVRQIYLRQYIANLSDKVIARY